MYVKSSSVSSWSYRSYVNPIKNHSQKKKSCKRTLILKRVTHIHIFFLDCSTISNNSENDDIFMESTTRRRSTPQPMATKTTSNPLRTQLSKTQNKLLTEGKTDFDGSLTSNMTLVYCAVIVGNRTSKFPSLTCRRLERGNTKYIWHIIRGGWERGKSYELYGKYSNPPSLCLAIALYDISLSWYIV